MKQIIKLFTVLSIGVLFTACNASKDYIVVIHTEYGDMKAILYEETPIHKKNFIELAEAGLYDSTTFHRVIENFMIQGGDVNKRPGIEEEEKINNTLPAEIIEGFYHQKGALAAARQVDQVNPKKRSSGAQFYIVHGDTFTEGELNSMLEGRAYQKKQLKIRELLSMNKYTDLRNEVIQMQKNQDMEGLQAFMENADSLVEKEFGKMEMYEFNDEQKKLYAEEGGAPHLDGEYTVFGRVVEGFNVIDSIATVEVGPGDKPVKDIPITIELDKMSKKKITEQYGYTYPKEEE